MQRLISSGHSLKDIKNYTQDELINFIEALNKIEADKFTQNHAASAHAAGNISTNDFLKALNGA